VVKGNAMRRMDGETIKQRVALLGERRGADLPRLSSGSCLVLRERMELLLLAPAEVCASCKAKIDIVSGEQSHRRRRDRSVTTLEQHPARSLPSNRHYIFVTEGWPFFSEVTRRSPQKKKKARSF